MLEPDTRHVLTDALRPPDGHRLDVAIATTYSLDLNSFILAPLAMAAHDHLSRAGESGPDPLALLESVRRYADHTTVFVQAGSIHVPGQYQRILAFAEECVAEVTAPSPDRLFHPKIWVLRFADASGTHHHRFLCLSRNLTADRSWDTVLRLDEAHDGTGADPAPLVAFLADLTTLTVRTLPESRKKQISDLRHSLGKVRFDIPSPFTEATLWPMGTNAGRGSPLPAQADDLVVISPFLDAGLIHHVRVPRTRIVSREETFERLGTEALPPRCETWVLQSSAESPDPDDTETEPTSDLDPTTGLHAKVFAWDEGNRGHVLTGSANATSAAFGGNVEFSVQLSGPVKPCGVASLWADGTDTPGLPQLLTPYTIEAETSSDDPLEHLEREIEAAHAALSAEGITVTVTPEADDYALTVEVPTLPLPEGSVTTIRPLGLAHGARTLERQLVWRPVAIQHISPFVVVETTLTQDGVTARRACVIKGTLVSDPADRHRSVLRDLLSNKAAVLRYLALLLGDPAFDSMVSALQSEFTTNADHASRVSRDDLVLFEPLLRATVRGDGALGRVAELLDELRDDSGELPHLSPEFQQLWDVVWQAVGKEIR